MSEQKKAWALVDRKKRTVRKDQYSDALAIFDTREAARRMQRRDPSTVVTPVFLVSTVPTQISGGND